MKILAAETYILDRGYRCRTRQVIPATSVELTPCVHRSENNAFLQLRRKQHLKNLKQLNLYSQIEKQKKKCSRHLPKNSFNTVPWTCIVKRSFNINLRCFYEHSGVEECLYERFLFSEDGNWNTIGTSKQESARKTSWDGILWRTLASFFCVTSFVVGTITTGLKACRLQ
jgi:hypothetical protein